MNSNPLILRTVFILIVWKKTLVLAIRYTHTTATTTRNKPIQRKSCREWIAFRYILKPLNLTKKKNIQQQRVRNIQNAFSIQTKTKKLGIIFDYIDSFRISHLGIFIVVKTSINWFIFLWLSYSLCRSHRFWRYFQPLWPQQFSPFEDWKNQKFWLYFYLIRLPSLLLLPVICMLLTNWNSFFLSQ